MKHVYLPCLFTLCFLVVACDTNGAAQSSSPASTASMPRSDVTRQHSVKAKETAPADLNSIINAVMKEQYSDHYDAKHECWEYSFKSGEGNVITYCMRPQAHSLVDTPTGKQLYFYTANVDNINDDSRYFYSHVNFGLMGAFKIKVSAENEWSTLAFNKEMDFGSDGSCDCYNAKFLKMSDHGDYGWLFTSGGIWQGTEVSQYVVLVAEDGSFKNISSIPEVTEDAQNIRYEIQVIDGTSDTKMFPLRVTETKSGVKVKDFTVKFDEKKNVYALPDNI